MRPIAQVRRMATKGRPLRSILLQSLGQRFVILLMYCLEIEGGSLLGENAGQLMLLGKGSECS